MPLPRPRNAPFPDPSQHGLCSPETTLTLTVTAATPSLTVSLPHPLGKWWMCPSFHCLPNPRSSPLSSPASLTCPQRSPHQPHPSPPLTVTQKAGPELPLSQAFEQAGRFCFWARVLSLAQSNTREFPAGLTVSHADTYLSRWRGCPSRSSKGTVLATRLRASGHQHPWRCRQVLLAFPGQRC